MLTTPFNLVDEFAHLASGLGGYLSMHFEVRVAGRIEIEDLRRATATAMERHPMARARMAKSKWRDRAWHWEIPSVADVDPVLPAENGDAGWDRAREWALDAHVELDASPPFRIQLVHHDEGDVLVFAINHAPLDGMAFVRLVQSIARAAAGDEDPAPPVDPLAVRDIGEMMGLSTPTPREGLLAIARLARDPAGPPGRIVKDGAVRRSGVGCVLETLGLEEVAAPGLTVTEVLVSALHRVTDNWSAARGKSLRRISTYVPINVRPPEWRHDVVGNFSLAATVTTMADERTDLSNIIEVIAGRMRALRDLSAVAELSPAMFALAGVPLVLRRGAPLLQPLAGRALDTSVVTNIGRMPPMTFGGDAGPVTGVWGFAPIRMPLGVGVLVTAVGDQIFLGFRYDHRQFSAEGANRFVAAYVESIREVVEHRFQSAE